MFIFSAVSGIFVAIFLTWITKSMWLDYDLANAKSNEVFGIIFGQLLFLVFAYQVMACSWGFIYNYAIESKRAQEIQLNNLRLINSLKDAQISSLTNQLNPHFLFNCLNNIRFVIHENQKKADEMIVNLSELLRYSLECSNKEKVELSTELDIIHKYIKLETIQLEQRLTFKLNSSDEFLEYLIPPMTLQLLVENAIKHGIEHLNKGGLIELDITQSADSLIFTVKNDKPAAYSLLKVGTKIGLRNIKQRLQLLYNQQSSLTIIDNDQLFEAKMIIPKEKCKTNKQSSITIIENEHLFEACN
ncbi:MAG: histidine kinase [Saccharospirillaceae bacterium]|nr:histidine kinase [Saccharospirillaceae bacterium]